MGAFDHLLARGGTNLKKKISKIQMPGGLPGGGEGGGGGLLKLRFDWYIRHCFSDLGQLIKG